MASEARINQPGNRTTLHRQSTTDRKPLVAKLAHHPRVSIGFVRQGKGRTDMREQHHIVALPAAGRALLPGKIPARADAKNLDAKNLDAKNLDAKNLDAKNLAEALEGKSFAASMRRNLIDVPPWRQKSQPSSEISRSWRRISFSRRNRFSSAARSSCRSGGGASKSRSRRLSSQRRSVDSPIPRSSTISLCVRPLVSTRRTASASNPFPNRQCGLPMNAPPPRRALHFPRASPPMVERGAGQRDAEIARMSEVAAARGPAVPAGPGARLVGLAEDHLALRATDGAPGPDTTLGRAADAGPQFGMATDHLLEDRDGSQTKCGLQHRHDLGLEEIAQRIGAAPCTRCRPGRRQPRIVRDAIAGRGTHRRQGTETLAAAAASVWVWRRCMMSLIW